MMSAWTTALRTCCTLLLFALVHATAFTQHTCASSKRGAHRELYRGGAPVLAPIDILHQRITLDLTGGSTIRGACAIRLVPRTEPLSGIDLDLEGLVVDSVSTADGLLEYTRSDGVLSIDLMAPAGVADTLDLTVHYGGDPIVDPSGFGGFYTTASLIYNLGVAFESIPHSYGRSWFPCLDNFTERSTYEFFIKTANGKRAWCNGSLVERIPLGGDTLVNHWACATSMPSYLASVAAANYVVARDTLPGVSGANIPVELVAFAADTADMKESFIHLPEALGHFESLFGPYRWEKIGFVLTTAGAMEHSTSIHYPTSIADGTLNYEATMAHELAHHWFGNLVTCDRAEEMYLNEGFAEYLSYLFLEAVYGRGRYMAEVRSNHRSMVHRAHRVDEGWWALSEVPQAWTYGTHSYNKGADVLHSLRSYMGDAAFSAGLTSFLAAHAFQPVNTTMLRDHLSMTSGMDMTDFFADWVQQPGWAAFEIGTQRTTPGGDGWLVELTIDQKMRGPASPYNNVPLTFTVVGTNTANVWRDTIPVGGTGTDLSFVVPFEPAWVWMNDDERLSLAFTGTTDTVTTTAAIISDQANMELRPRPGAPTLVRMEQYWVPPDQGTFAEPHAYVLSPDRYWRVTGNWANADRFTARFPFDGRNTISSLDGGLMRDSLGVEFHEDSLVLLHRPDQQAPWRRWASEVVNLGSTTDTYGRIEADSLLPGEYALAWRTSPVGMDGLDAPPLVRIIGPNPADDVLHLQLADLQGTGLIQVLNTAGSAVIEIPATGTRMTLDTSALSSGAYAIRCTRTGQGAVDTGKFIVRH